MEIKQHLQLSKWINEVKDLSKNYFKSKKIAIDVLNGPAVTALNKEGIEVVDAKLILEQARVIKSPDELTCMKAAIEVAEKGVSKMRSDLKPGMTEDELWSILHKTNIENGGEWIECRFYLLVKEQIHGCKRVVIKLCNKEKLLLLIQIWLVPMDTVLTYQEPL